MGYTWPWWLACFFLSRLCFSWARRVMTPFVEPSLPSRPSLVWIETEKFKKSKNFLGISCQAKTSNARSPPRPTRQRRWRSRRHIPDVCPSDIPFESLMGCARLEVIQLHWQRFHTTCQWWKASLISRRATVKLYFLPSSHHFDFGFLLLLSTLPTRGEEDR